MRLKTGVDVAGQASLKPRRPHEPHARLRQILNPIAETLRLQTPLAGRGAVVQPKRPAPAAAGANEEGPAAAVGETDVLQGDGEGKRRQPGTDGRGFVVGPDVADGPHAGGAKETADRQSLSSCDEVITPRKKLKSIARWLCELVLLMSARSGWSWLRSQGPHGGGGKAIWLYGFRPRSARLGSEMRSRFRGGRVNIRRMVRRMTRARRCRMPSIRGRHSPCLLRWCCDGGQLQLAV